MTVQRKRIIVAGGGQVGVELSRALVSRDHQVVIVERDSDRCEILNDQYIASVIHGDATDPTVLAQAEPTVADALVALTDSVSTNLVICRIARELGIPETMTVGDETLADAEVEDVEIIEYDEESQPLVVAVLRQVTE